MKAYGGPNRRVRLIHLAYALMCTAIVAACGKADKTPTERSASGLTPFELKHGVGPVRKEVRLGPIDSELASRGRSLFFIHCSTCHRMESSKVGPELGRVLVRRSGTYVMNMILAPEEMITRHPAAQSLASAFPGKEMPRRVETVENARALLEFIRSEQVQ